MQLGKLYLPNILYNAPDTIKYHNHLIIYHLIPMFFITRALQSNIIITLLFNIQTNIALKRQQTKY